ncbi:MAG: hypothetical protein WD361_02370 [Gracilimonas sp.]
MNNLRLVILNLFIISASVLCFEIIATRISSVIFVNNYAFMILSLAILGLACGGIFSYYKLLSKSREDLLDISFHVLLLLGVSLLVFIVAVTKISFITNPFVFFFFLFWPFFFAGIFYAKIFEVYAEASFNVYAADLVGAAVGSIASIITITFLGPGNGILLLAILVICSAISFKMGRFSKFVMGGSYLILIFFGGLLVNHGNTNVIGRIPIGEFPEKDFHHTYPNLRVQSIITDSRWSIFGRADLVEYSHQNVVRHLFVDGAAGTQMLRFNGNLNKQDQVLTNLLLESTSFIPYLFLRPEEKDNMLVIGPGGGKEVLGGLVTGVRQITGVEINPDFVNIVKDQRAFNGGIYTDFSNVDILVGEGRQYVKQKPLLYDVLVMALPSTQQLQSIDNYALSENFLLTVEAIRDYLDILTPEGQIIFTVHNPWELKRLIATTMTAFEERDISPKDVLNHIIVFETDYAPTVIVKKEPYMGRGVQQILEMMSRLQENAPKATYMPGQWQSLPNTTVNNFLNQVKTSRNELHTILDSQRHDVNPVYDDSPYFYKIEPGIPDSFNKLFYGVLFAGLLIIVIPMAKVRKTISSSEKKYLQKVIALFTAIGVGFMIVEIALFQKLILYLGSPTTSLSILLSSLLVGMGLGSFCGRKFYPDKPEQRTLIFSGLIVMTGMVVIYLYPFLLGEMLVFEIVFRSIVTFQLLLPFGFLLGVLFPTFIQLLEEKSMGRFIPWMYGINGAMSVLGSVLAVILSMFFGFTPSFLVGLSCYLFIFLLIILANNDQK